MKNACCCCCLTNLFKSEFNDVKETADSCRYTTTHAINDEPEDGDDQFRFLARRARRSNDGPTPRPQRTDAPQTREMWRKHFTGKFPRPEKKSN